ncbi:MAG: hypothetical protein CM1200mP36_00730 [Gammaproteobacteria bacterium]|nr:MAG: hypothetical protein CM1200mP36_00730 [Gammaproteobacteria bacterium]
MDRLHLTLAAWDYDRVRPLLDGTIRPEGIEVEPIVSRPSETFFRMLRRQEFDVSELSLSNYTMLRAGGDDRFVAIPVFPSRQFRHSCIYVNKNAGIDEPKDLIGKKVGVPEYSMTAAVFARGLLLHDYGVTPDSIEWFSGTQDGLTRPSRIDFDLPESVVLHRMPIEQDMGPMLEEGDWMQSSPPMPRTPWIPALAREATLQRLPPNGERILPTSRAYSRSCIQSSFAARSTRRTPGPLLACTRRSLNQGMGLRSDH